MRSSDAAWLAAVILASTGQPMHAQDGLPRFMTAVLDQNGTAQITALAPGGPPPQVIDATAGPLAGLLSLVSPVPKASCNFVGAPTPLQAEALVKRIATEENFFPRLVLAVARTESHFHMESISPKGAIGIMQLMPATAARFKVDICDPASNVRGGIQYLRWLHDRYKNPFFILAAYNAGEAAVDRYRGVPPFPETVQYVAAVLNDFYAWPLPGLSSNEPSPSPEPVSTADTGQRESVWSQGFVMHLEN
jgi:hypothetical protein